MLLAWVKPTHMRKYAGTWFWARRTGFNFILASPNTVLFVCALPRYKSVNAFLDIPWGASLGNNAQNLPFNHLYSIHDNAHATWWAWYHSRQIFFRCWVVGKGGLEIRTRKEYPMSWGKRTDALLVSRCEDTCILVVQFYMGGSRDFCSCTLDICHSILGRALLKPPYTRAELGSALCQTGMWAVVWFCCSAKNWTLSSSSHSAPCLICFEEYQVLTVPDKWLLWRGGSLCVHVHHQVKHGMSFARHKPSHFSMPWQATHSALLLLPAQAESKRKFQHKLRLRDRRW